MRRRHSPLAEGGGRVESDAARLSRSRRLPVFVAACAVSLTACASGESSGPTTTETVPTSTTPDTLPIPTTTVSPVSAADVFEADVAFIELHMDTFFESGDFETAIAHFGSNPREGDGTNVSEILYQAAIESDVTVTDCMLGDRTRFYECTVSYSNMLFEAVGEPPLVTHLQFEVIRDGLLRTFGEQYPGNNPVSSEWLRFEQAMGLDEDSSCRDWGSNSISCPKLQREHLDDFVAWWAENHSG